MILVSLSRFAYIAHSRGHSLVGSVEMNIVSLLHYFHDGRLNRRLVPRPETPGFPSKIRLPINTNTIPIPVPR